MSASNVPNFAWQELSPVIKVGSLHGIITLPAFNASCGPSKISRQWFGSYYDGALPASLAGLTAITFECWIKPLAGYRAVDAYIIKLSSTAVALRLNADLTVGFRLKRVGDPGVTTLNSATKLNIEEWNHVVACWNGTTMLIYINAVVDANTQALAAGALFGTAAANFRLLDYFQGGNSSAPNICNELRIWNVARTALQIRQAAHYQRDVTGTIDVGLVAYYPLMEGAGLTISNKIVGNVALMTYTTYGLDTTFWLTTDVYPFRLGSAFVAGRFSINSNGKIYSLRKPRKPSNDTNFTPCIAWVDSDNALVVHRYRLWEGVSNSAPATIPLYNSQRIPDGAFLEIWNSDGESTVNLTTAIDLETSILHTVIENDVITRTVDSTVAIDTTLAEAFPLAFPIPFNTQQTYIG